MITEYYRHGFRAALIVAATALSIVVAAAWCAAEDAKKPTDSKPADKPAAATVPTIEKPKPAKPQTPPQAVARALKFLVSDVEKWRKDRGCATCHHGAMSVWALGEAKRHGYSVDAEKLAEITAWTKNRLLANLTKPRDSRPGWNLVSMPSIYFGVMSQDLPVLSRGEVHQLAGHLVRHQEADGAWIMPPPANGAPPTWESQETVALWALLAWEPTTPADPEQAAAERKAREKALAWLAQVKPSETTQALALRLVWDQRNGKMADQLKKPIDQLLGRQKSDGGWSQTPDLPSDAYATGQTLWALSVAGVEAARPEIRRAVEFLATTQRDDGSWPMKSRNHPGVESKRDPLRNPMPITYFGATWATIGLVRFTPPEFDVAAKQKLAFDIIREFGGKYEVDDKAAGKPVVKVSIVYEVNDEELAKLTGLLTAFPELKTLQMKSSRVTDAGRAALKKTLPQVKVEP